MKVQNIDNSLALVYRALAAANPERMYTIRIYCDLYEGGYQDVDMKFIEELGEWAEYDLDCEDWWPVSKWTLDIYENVELLGEAIEY